MSPNGSTTNTQQQTVIGPLRNSNNNNINNNINNNNYDKQKGDVPGIRSGERKKLLASVRKNCSPFLCVDRHTTLIHGLLFPILYDLLCCFHSCFVVFTHDLLFSLMPCSALSLLSMREFILATNNNDNSSDVNKGRKEQDGSDCGIVG